MASPTMTAGATPDATVRARRRAWSRGILAGPVGFVVAFVVMAGASLWVPQGPAQIDNIAVPIVIFPVIWAAVFFYLMLDRNLVRAWTVAALVLLLHAGVIGRHVMAVSAAKQAGAAPTTPASAAAVAAGASK